MEYANKHLNLDAMAAISKYKAESLKNRSSEPPRIQHEIYSGSDWLRGFPKNLSESQKSGREGYKAPEPHLPLHPPMLCDLLYPNGRRSTKSQTLHLFLLPSITFRNLGTVLGATQNPVL
jgi:hypothetical protein